MVTAQRLARRRRGERGATVFVVVLAISLLTTVGLFAAHSATVVDQAAGYARLARQTGYFAEYGALSMVAVLGTGSASEYVDLVESGRYTCPSTRALKEEYPEGRFDCYPVDSTRLAQTFATLSNSEPLLVDQKGTTLDRLGYAPTATTGVTGSFVVEITDSIPWPAPPGNTGEFRRLTTTTIATLRPPGDQCAAGNPTLAAQQSLRSHLIVPYTR